MFADYLATNNVKFLRMYDFLEWYFGQNKLSSAYILSFLIDAEQYHDEDGGYFMCTNDYIASRLPYTAKHISAIIKELEHQGFIDFYILNQKRFVKLNVFKLKAVLDLYNNSVYERHCNKVLADKCTPFTYEKLQKMVEEHKLEKLGDDFHD